VTDIGLWAIAANDPERTAVIDPRGAAISYAELAALADRYARGLQEPRPGGLGLRPGDCVAGMLPNSTEALALFFAAIETGLYVVPVNWSRPRRPRGRASTPGPASGWARCPVSRR
jgi:long-chain acyl-CoA synthetase